MTGVLQRLATGALAGVVTLVIALPVSAQSARQRLTIADNGANGAARWLAGQLTEGALPGPGAGPDWDLTVDALLALSATNAGQPTLDLVAGNLAAHVRKYKRGVRISGATAKLLFGAVAAGRDPSDFGGYDLRQETLDLIAGPDAGWEQGRLRNKGTADDSNTFGQSLGVLGLARSGAVPQPAVDFLIEQQCAAGGFRSRATAAEPTCDQAAGAVLDPDSTGMAVQALLAADKAGNAGPKAAVGKGAAWLASIQREDGSFGGSGPTEASNTISTGLAGQALAAAGRTDAANKAAGFVSSLQLTAANAGKAAEHIGAIAYNKEAFTRAVRNGMEPLQLDQWRRASAQGVLVQAVIPLSEPSQDTPPPDPVERAARYLVARLVDGTHVEVKVEDTVFVDYGQTVDIAFGLLASGRQPDVPARMLDYLSTKDNVDSYVHGSTAGTNYAGATAKLAFLLLLAGKDPHKAGGYDLIAELQGLQQAGGRFADRGSANYANTFSQSFGVLALTAAGQQSAADKAAKALSEAQCKDGRFPVNFPPAGGCDTGTIDATGLAALALNASSGSDELAPERRDALVKTVRAIQAGQDTTGAWQGLGGLNVNSTGYAAMGLLASGLPILSSSQWLSGLQADDGGFPVNPGQPSNGLATAQALPAYAGKSLLTTGSPRIRPAIKVPAADPEAPSPAPIPTPARAQHPDPVPQARQAPVTPLAHTGSPVWELGIAALVLLSGGVAMRLSSRRKRVST